eukprot:scaffold1401_cov330-Pavlova_lutheri.AAC.130
MEKAAGTLCCTSELPLGAVAEFCYGILAASNRKRIVAGTCSSLAASLSFVSLDFGGFGWGIGVVRSPRPAAALPGLPLAKQVRCHVANDLVLSPPFLSEGPMAVGLQPDSLEGDLAPHWP